VRKLIRECARPNGELATSTACAKTAKQGTSGTVAADLPTPIASGGDARSATSIRLRAGPPTGAEAAWRRTHIGEILGVFVVAIAFNDGLMVGTSLLRQLGQDRLPELATLDHRPGG
jgi:hypothetical protein